MTAATSPTRFPIGSTVVRVFVYAASVAAFAFPMATPATVVAAMIGAALGAIGGPLFARSSLRSLTLTLGAALLLAACLALLGSNVLQASLATAWGPEAALGWKRHLQFFAGSFGLGCWLCALSLRHRFFSIGEVAFSATAVASLVIGHRHGAINRPFEIADPIIASGGDPTIAILSVGVVAAALVVLLLLRERGVWRSVLHILVVVALLFLVLRTTSWLGLPEPPAGGGLGLRSEQDAKSEQQPGGSGTPRGKSNNDDLEFRDDNSPSRNQAPVAVVLLHDDYSPPRGLYYFRQGAFSQYNGRRLVSATRADADQDLIPNFPTGPMTIAAASNDGMMRNGMRATLDTTVALMAEHARPFALESPVSLQPEPNPDPTRFRRVYRVTSAALTADEYALLGHELFSPKWSQALRDHYTRAPDDPRYAALAKKILGDVREDLRDEPAVKAMAVTEWLGREGTYSLKTKHAAAEDPTADFLFGDKIGYCVHFAHAAAYLLRSAGVPTRVATGYVLEESARQGGSAMVLTSANSHAWPEVYIDGVGWVVMDVSPQRSLDPPPPPPDPDLQRLLGQLARGEQPTASPGARDLQPLIAAASQMFDALLRVTGAGLLLLMLALYLIKAWRRALPHFASPSQLPRVIYRAQLDRLAEASLHREPGESREAFARRVTAITPTFTQLTARHVAIAFGSHNAPDVSQLKHDARTSARELRTTAPLWKRLLGIATPWSWLRAR